MFASFTLGDHLVFWGFFLVLGLSIAAFASLFVFPNMSPYYDYGDGFRRFLEKFHKEESETPKALKPMISAPTNRDFVIEVLKLRKETLEKDGYDPMCPKNASEEERIAADRLAASLECLVNKYQDPDDFDKAFSKINKINNKKEN